MRRWPVLIAAIGLGCGGGNKPPAQVQNNQHPKITTPIVVIRVDSDHDGALSAADDTARKSGGEGIFLANLDDDDNDKKPDANDEVVNGADDILDLAPAEVLPWPDAPDDATGFVRVDAVVGAIRLFRIDGDASNPASYKAQAGGAELSAADLRAGVKLAVEGRAVRQSTQDGFWDGTAKLTLIVTRGTDTFTDSAPMRVAPVLMQYNTALPREVFYTGGEPFNADFAAAVTAALEPSKIPVTGLELPGTVNDWDPWAQDFWDLGHSARPGPGKVVEMLYAIRSAQPDRVAGGVVDRMLGPNVGTIFIHDTIVPLSDLSYSMNSFGDWDVIPPHDGYPLGRNIWGAGPTPDLQPDQVYQDFVKAQGAQGFINVDTSFLVVGHVDEIISWVQSDDARGFRLLAASPSMAKQMLQDMSAAGHGDVEMFVGKNWINFNDPNQSEYPAAVSVDTVLADADRMASSQESQVRTNEALAILLKDLNMTTGDVVLMPTLFEKYGDRNVAYQPGTVNLLPVGKTLVIADPFGPVIDGKDPFKEDIRSRVGGLGYDVEFVDDWDIYHREMGEVHCATNANRAINVAFWVKP